MLTIFDFGSVKTPAIAEVITSLGHKNNVIPWQKTAPDCYNHAEGIILSGAPIMFTELEHTQFLQTFNFLKTIEIPVLGICFGHQLIGLLHGSSVFKGEEINHDELIEIIPGQGDSPLFEGIASKAVFREDHREGIDLPEGFIHLATSASFRVEAMQHAHKRIYGVQFHPEVSGENGIRLLHNFCSICYP